MRRFQQFVALIAVHLPRALKDASQLINMIVVRTIAMKARLQVAFTSFRRGDVQKIAFAWIVLSPELSSKTMGNPSHSIVSA